MLRRKYEVILVDAETGAENVHVRFWNKTRAQYRVVRLNNRLSNEIALDFIGGLGTLYFDLRERS